MSDENFDKLVFKQELNEVYLLMDFVSGRPDKHLTDLDRKITVGDVAMTSSQVIEKVSLLRFPPPSGPEQRGQDAAFLLLVKDALNTIAYPARGMTIAYTTLFTQEDAPANAKTTGDGAKDAQADAHRMEVARLAYPMLAANAVRFRRLKDRLAIFSLVVTVLAAVLLWQVTYGVQLAARFDEAKRNDSATAAKVHEEIDRKWIGQATTATGGGAGGADHRHDLREICRLTDTVASKPDDREAAIQQLCNEYAYRHAQLCVAVGDVGAYSQFWLFRAATTLLPMHEPEAALDCAPGSDAGAPTPASGGVSGTKPVQCGSSAERADCASAKRGRQEDAQSIVGVLAMLSNYLLPILFGLVGTLTAFVRGVQDKVTESVLSPRDRALALIRLPLGMVAGV